MVQREVVIETIGDLRRGSRLDAVCEACHRSVALDVPTLIIVHGDDLRLDRLARLLRCQACGARYPQTHLMFSYDMSG